MKRRDLHALTRELGIDVVAPVLGVTPRTLVNMRRGESPITVDELHAACEAWPDFDLSATVSRIGALREVYGKSKRARFVQLDKEVRMIAALEGIDHPERKIERAKLAGLPMEPAPKPGELEQCATCPKPRPCDGCPALRDAIDGRR